MNFIKKLFKFKKPKVEEPLEVPVSEKEINPSKVPEVEGNIGDYETCHYCGLRITENHRVVHKFGHAYHLKPCWRQTIKDARKGAFN